MFYSDDIFDNRDIHSFITKQQWQDYVFQKSSKNLADYKDEQNKLQSKNNHQISLNSVKKYSLIYQGNYDEVFQAKSINDDSIFTAKVFYVHYSDYSDIKQKT